MDFQEVVTLWKIDFESFITKVEALIANKKYGWEGVDSATTLELLSENEKELLRINGLNFNLPEGIGDAYDLRSQVQNMIESGDWSS